MKDTLQTRLTKTAATLVALALVLSVMGPVGTVAAVDGITVTQQADSTTVNAGDTITFTTDVSVDSQLIDANSIGLQTDLPDGWTVTSRTSGTNLGAGPDGWLWFSTTSVSGSDTVQYTVQVPGDAESGDYTVGVTAATEDGASTTDETTITVGEPAQNTPPTADAGDDQTVDAGANVQLDGTGSGDSDGSVAGYSWTQMSGPSVSLSDASSVQPTFTAPSVSSETTLTFELEVTDDDGATATDTVSVTVQPPAPGNQSPTADAGPDQTVDESATVVLTGESSSDTDGSIASYSWTQTSGPSVSLSDASAATPSFTAPDVDAESTLTFELEVTDDDGATDTDTVSVTVQDADEPPAGDMETSVSMAPTSSSTFVGGTTTYELVVDDAQGGVGAYTATVTLDDPSVGEITDVDLQGNPAGQTTSVDIAADGSSVTINAALMDTADSGSVGVATITVQGEAPGSTDLTPTVSALGNEQGTSYAVTGTSGAAFSVTEKSTSVSLSPTSSETSVDNTVTYDVVVDNAQGGVGAYTASVTLDDPSIGTITDVQLLGSPASQTSDVEIAPDGSSVSIDAALMDTADSGSVTIATITVQGEAPGSTDLSVAVDALGDEDGNNYAVTETNGASMTVTEVTVGDFLNPVTDPDGDGLYEDINGDGQFNIVDVQALFANLNDESVQNNEETFDFNNDGVVNIVDVQALFFEFTNSD